MEHVIKFSIGGTVSSAFVPGSVHQVMKSGACFNLSTRYINLWELEPFAVETFVRGVAR